MLRGNFRLMCGRVKRPRVFPPRPARARALVLGFRPTREQVADGAPTHHHAPPRCFQDGSLVVSSIYLTAEESGSPLIGCHGVSVASHFWSTGDHAQVRTAVWFTTAPLRLDCEGRVSRSCGGWLPLSWVGEHVAESCVHPRAGGEGLTPDHIVLDACTSREPSGWHQVSRSFREISEGLAAAGGLGSLKREGMIRHVLVMGWPRAKRNFSPNAVAPWSQ